MSHFVDVPLRCFRNATPQARVYESPEGGCSFLLSENKSYSCFFALTHIPRPQNGLGKKSKIECNNERSISNKLFQFRVHLPKV